MFKTYHRKYVLMIQADSKRSGMAMLSRIMAFVVGVVVNFDHFSIMGVSVVSLIIIIYMTSVLLTYGSIRIKINERRFYWPPIVYLLLLVFLNIVNINEVSSTIIPISFVFCLILYYITSIHVRNDPKSIVSFISGIAVGGILMTLFFYRGIGVEYESGRLFLFGSNPNNLGCLMCISAAIVLYVLIIKDFFKIIIFRYAVVVLLIPIVQVVFATASRTAFLALAIVVAETFILSPTKRKITKILYIVAFAAIIYVTYKSLSDYETLYMRVFEMGETEDYSSGREDRWLTLFYLVLENPLGMGQTGFAEVAKTIMSSSDIDGMASPHNVFLEVLLYTGFWGFGIMTYYWFHIVKKTWLYFKDNKDLLFVLIMSVLLVQMMLGQILIFRVAWIVFGIVAGIYLPEENKSKIIRAYGRE